MQKIRAKPYKCSCCSKKISSLSYDLREYVYKVSSKYFCSWSCMQKFKSNIKKPRKYNRVKLNKSYSI